MKLITPRTAILLSAAALTLAACGGDNTDNPAPIPIPDPQPGPVTGISVYAAGYNGSDADESRATYWKDGGEPVALSDDYSGAQEIAACGSDVYIYGSTLDKALTTRTINIWKNGQVLYTHKPGSADIHFYTTTMAVQGKDIYYGIDELSESGDKENDTWSFSIWKNGQRIRTIPHEPGANVSSITVSGSDVYFTLTKDADRYNNIPAAVEIWKNAERLYTLNGNSEWGDIRVHALRVSGNDIYAAGSRTFQENFYRYTKAVIWKNAAQLHLMEGSPSRSSAAYDLLIDGNDMYAAGNYGSSGAVWKNGQPLYTVDGHVSFYALAFDGKDLYIAGDTHPGSNTANANAKVWKNGELLYALSGGAYTSALSVALVGGE